MVSTAATETVCPHSACLQPHGLDGVGADGSLYPVLVLVPESGPEDPGVDRRPAAGTVGHFHDDREVFADDP